MSRHVSTRCPRMEQHLKTRLERDETTGGMKVVHLYPFPCEKCYSIESRVIPWEPPGTDKPEKG